jgi:hypothetical protein
MDIKRTLAGAGAMMVLLIAGHSCFNQLFSDRNEGTGLTTQARQSDSKSTSPSAGLQARHVDPAGPRHELVRNPALSAKWQALADNASAIDALTAVDAVSTRVALQDARRFDVEDRCRQRLNWPTDVDPTCTFSLTTVIDDRGAVALVRIAETSMDVLTPLCAALAECVAEDRLQQRIPLSPEHQDAIAVSQTIRTKPLNEHFNDPDYVHNMVLTLQDDLSASIDMPNTPDLQFAIMQQENLIGYLQQRLDRLKEQTQDSGNDG